MGDITSPSSSHIQTQQKSLKLRPLEKLQNAYLDNKANQIQTKMEYFEIQGPSNETNLKDIIYPLIQLEITKAKVYVTKVTDKAIHQVVVLTPIVTQTLWDKFKTYLKWFDSDNANRTLDTQKYTTIEEEDYIVIQPIESSDTEKKGKPEEESYDMICSSMLESSFILFSSKNLKSINQLHTKSEMNLSNPISIDFCESLIQDNTKYKNSFNISSDGSIIYAPEATSSSFRAYNCLAAEFELVGNKIIIQDLESFSGDQIFELDQNVEVSVPTVEVSCNIR